MNFKIGEENELYPRRAVIGSRRRHDFRSMIINTAAAEPAGADPRGVSRASRCGVPRPGAEPGTAIRVHSQFRGDRAPRRAKCTDKALRSRPRDLESRQ